MRCPRCRFPISRWSGLLTETRARGVRCARCDSELVVSRRWRPATWLAVSMILAVAAFNPLMPNPLAAVPVARFQRWTAHRSWEALVRYGVIPLGTWLALVVLLPRHVRLIAAGTRCRGCGYDLRGLTRDRCPECGLEAGTGPRG